MKNKLTTKWIGIEPDQLTRYNKEAWKNKESNANCCGPISTAIMLAYYQDHLNTLVIDPHIRKAKSNTPGSMIALIKASTFLATSTIPPTLCRGVNQFLKQADLNQTYKAKWKLLTWKKAKVLIENNQLVCIGILGFRKINGINDYDYGWHWVTAYGYCIIDGKRYYRCIDNWGHLDVTIKASTTLGMIYLAK